MKGINLKKQVNNYSDNIKEKFLGKNPISTKSITNNLIIDKKVCNTCIKKENYIINRDTLRAFERGKE